MHKRKLLFYSNGKLNGTKTSSCVNLSKLMFYSNGKLNGTKTVKGDSMSPRMFYSNGKLNGTKTHFFLSFLFFSFTVTENLMVLKLCFRMVFR